MSLIKKIEQLIRTGVDVRFNKGTTSDLEVILSIRKPMTQAISNLSYEDLNEEELLKRINATEAYLFKNLNS